MNYYIEEAKIINRKLVLEGWIVDSNISLFVSFNNKRPVHLELNKDREEINKHFNISDKKLGFSYNISCPSMCSKIKIIIKNNNEEIDNIVLNNSIFSKIGKKICKIFSLIGKTFKVLRKHPGILFSRKLLKKYKDVFFDKYYNRNKDDSLNPFDQKEYIEWIIRNENIFDKKEEFSYQPKISFILPVYNPKLSDFKECIDSILKQTYTNYEVCLVDDCSTDKSVLDYIDSLKNNNKFKIYHNSENLHISKSSNKAISMAEGDFIALIDHDDTISSNALYECVKVLNDDKTIDFIYSDFDKLDKKGLRCEPYFKPDYAPDTLLNFNYLSHFNLIRKSIVESVGMFNPDMIGAQDYDLYLRIVEKTNKIEHISKILYHWRMAENSTSTKKSSKNYAYLNGKKAIEEALKRRNIDAEVITKENSSFYTVEYKYSNEPKISIIIPTRDYGDILKKCVDSLISKTTYKNYEIIIIDNGTTDKKTLELLEEYNKNDKIRIVKLDCEFNFSYLNNEAIKVCNGEYIVLLNNDTELITPNWLNVMVGYAMQEHIGTVGVKLLYPDNTIQHGGVVLGLGGVASHSFIGEPRHYRGFNGLLEVPTNYAAVTAACLMVKKSKYLEVNGLSEELKVAYNDIDFNIKLLEAGYYNIFLPQVELYHYESKSRGLDTTGEKYERFLKESSIMMNKWGSYIRKDPFYNPNYSLKSAFRLDRTAKVGGSHDEE